MTNTGRRPTDPGGDYRREARRPVPDDLRHVDLLADLPPADLAPIGREDLARVSDAALDAACPDWVRRAPTPRRAVRSRGVGAVTLRGMPVDPLVIFGNDDRKVYDDQSYPWGCVCRIQRVDGSGSGVIIGPRHVLTASHVINWATFERQGIAVEVHRAGPRVRAATTAARVCYITKVADVTGTTVDEDYAVIVTRDRIGDRFGYLGCQTYDNDWDEERYWRCIGYAPAIRNGDWPCYQRDKYLDEPWDDFGSARAMMTDADLERGQSGSPMFAWFGDDPRVVAVASAQVEEDHENYCAGGSDLTRLVRYARDTWP